MHTHFSPDSEVVPERLVARCKKVGLNCIAVTDHNTIQGAKEVQRIAPFMVIVGEEVGTAEGEITGLFLEETVPRGLPAIETAKRIKDQGGLVSMPHPFDRFRRGVIGRVALEELLPLTDIVEVFNSRNNFRSDNRKAQEFAQQHGLLTSAVSDAHLTFELGRTYVELPEFDGSPEGFKEALARSTYVGRKTSPLIHVATTLTKLKKRAFRSRPPDTQ